MLCLTVMLGCLLCTASQLTETTRCYGSSRNPTAPQKVTSMAPKDTPNLPEDSGAESEQKKKRIRFGVDELSTEPPLPFSCPHEDKHDEFVQQVFARNVAEGAVFQQEDAQTVPRPPSSALQKAAQEIETAGVLAASPEAPRFKPLALDVLPQKYWQPVFAGCQSTFTDQRCDFSYPTPRLWVPTLDELLYARSLEQGRVNLIEPLEARQGLAQLLSVGVRTKRDVYTQAHPANDIASQSPCAQLRKQSPSFVWR